MSKDRTTENCNLLFEYLHSILYDSEIQQPDFDLLDEPFEDLGAGLRVLQRFVEEMLTYSKELSNGELSGTYPSRDNFLCANLKNLHANLNHLTWQAKRVAVGDYSQHVSYLGEFSVAFNTMIQQLKEREESLHEQIERTRRQMAVIEQYNNLFEEMMNRKDEWFVVAEVGSAGNFFYCNKRPDSNEHEDTGCSGCQNRGCLVKEILAAFDPDAHKTWEWGDAQKGYFRVTSLPIQWRGKSAFAHVIDNITEEKQTEDKLVSHAYYDAGTGVHNRFFFEEYLQEQLNAHADFVLCFMDLDGLKYVNDHFGHNEGDVYIRRFVEEILRSFRATDTFARVGGDEFCLLLPHADPELIREKLEKIRKHFIESNPASYPSSFSYGLVQTNGEAGRLTPEEALDEADRLMYEYKNKNKLR